MDIEIYNQATAIFTKKECLRRAIGCDGTFNAPRVKNALAKFAEYYGIDFALYVQKCLKKEQKAFDALQCCSYDKEPGESEKPEENG